MIEVRRYAAGDRERWDAFVRAAKNATFLFERGYMEYHADRFADHSLLFVDGAGELVGALPASEREGELVSHGGLTYGGVVCGAGMRAALMLEVFEALLAHVRSAGLRRLVYKPVPHIYHALPAEEDLYALFRV
ncbi:MAG TPA: GNAT family N-acetyltransferase, partial [Planctomycetota bacterium]|nr:GNAT family N-acetyltransferase [Planctomycetota bacterium]